jgi:hypothetical protein
MPREDSSWDWDRKSRRYRGKDTGRYMSHGQVTNLRDKYTDARRTTIRSLVRETLPLNAKADPLSWNVGVRVLREKGWREVERSMIAQYTFGRGGTNAMTSADRVIVQQMLRDQKGYWDRFMMEALQSPDMSMEYAANRATMYADASTAFYERGRETAFDIRLPGHPGDGGTECLSRCRCSWEIVERKTKVEAIWHANGGDNVCDGCRGRAAQWSLLTFERVTEGT